MRVLYLPLGRSTFCLDEAVKKLEEVRSVLNRIFPQMEGPEKLLVEVENLRDFILERLHTDMTPVDAVIVQPITFTDARFIRQVTDLLEVPVLIWSVREPQADGGRLCLNSLTGANLYARELRKLRQFTMVHGNPLENGVLAEVRRKLFALVLMGSLSRQTMLTIGEVPDGFFFSEVTQEQLAPLGIKVKKLPLAEVFTTAQLLADEAVLADAEVIQAKIAGVKSDNIETKTSAKLLHTVRNYVRQEGIGLVATRCWPDYFVQAGVAPCSVVSLLNDEGIPASCERDVLGAVSMFLLSTLSGQPAYLGDLVHLDEVQNTLTFWHCGSGAPTLAGREGARVGVHPNRKLGISIEMQAKSGPVTVARLGLDAGRLRLLVMEGRAMDVLQKFLGTCVDVEPDGIPARDWIAYVMGMGYEPHYAVGYGHWADVLVEWAGMEGIEVNKL